ncbi:MAG: hypothetical protein NTX65_05095 [Ignavibacteriales bacterium]|nr:hypothetical protein [Ignavibacteriales bacterium]
MKRLLLIGFFLLLFCVNCKDSSTDPSERKGAVCKDGTRTDATGSGACSSHGGVDHWLY